MPSQAERNSERKIVDEIQLIHNFRKQTGNQPLFFFALTMAPLPSLKVNKTLFEQIRLQFEKNPQCARQQVADVMFHRAIQLDVELDGNKWITALVQSLCL